MIFHCGILIIIMFNIHGPCDIIDHIHPITGSNDEGKEKCR